ncbi:trypsin-like peptidase domain-containing protein [Streptomyces afghaniensis]|uniref:S1 family peptidase n=1 Tax=Streptomyces TaxID=1883 RepID=UPI001FAE9B34|nr:serine protease [Streptomyces sp. HP-A2021]UOB15369.1 trypsin-like peptidase domain-containing protein [Streptomyces sp. HP-A2021]
MGVRDETRQEQQRQAAAASRYEETSERRRQTRQQLKAVVPFPDSPEALATRAARLLERQAVPAAMVGEAVQFKPLDAPAAFERILGVSKELHAWNFLPRRARSVARISACECGRELPVGTGFLVSPSLLMTNHHVLPDADTALTCFLEFDAQVTVDNTPQLPIRLGFAPDTLFLADKRLDFAPVMVAPGPEGTPPGQTFDWHRLSAHLDKPVIDEPVNVIGHPMGRLKEIAVRDNALEARLDDFARYRTDTKPGNSGAPVFSDQREVVALHHSGVPKTDEQGRVLRRDGQVWQPFDCQDAANWTSNEGVRISSILRHLASLPVTPAQRALLAEMSPESGLDTTTATTGTGNPPPTASPTATDTGGPAPVPAPDPVPARATTEAAPACTGLRARDGAFGGCQHLLFLQGRSQPGKDPELLRRDWAAELNQDLLWAGQPPVDPTDIWFPFYGNRLMDTPAEHVAIPMAAPLDTDDPVTPATAVPTAPTPRALYEELLTEAATTWHIPPPHTAGPRADRPGPGHRSPEAALGLAGRQERPRDLNHLPHLPRVVHLPRRPPRPRRGPELRARNRSWHRRDRPSWSATAWARSSAWTSSLDCRLVSRPSSYPPRAARSAWTAVQSAALRRTAGPGEGDGLAQRVVPDRRGGHRMPADRRLGIRADGRTHRPGRPQRPRTVPHHRRAPRPRPRGPLHRQPPRLLSTDDPGTRKPP